jgi:hypothetical protein
MRHHWEISWTTLQPLADDEVRRAVLAIARLGCSWPDFDVECVEDAYVAVRHRRDDEFLIEFGFASAAPCCSDPGADGGLVSEGQVAWNWCCTGKRQPETGLVIHKLAQVQAIANDKLLIWDDDGHSHWSWGSCPLTQVDLDPMPVVDAHLRALRLPPRMADAS